MLTCLIILLPILVQIRSPIGILAINSYITLGEIILIPFMIGSIIKYIYAHKGGVMIPKGLGAFYFIPIVLVLMSATAPYFQMSDAMTVIIRIIYYFTLIIIMRDDFDIKKGISLYYHVGLIAACYLLAQVICHYILKSDLPILFNYPNILFKHVKYISAEQYYHQYFIIRKRFY